MIEAAASARPLILLRTHHFFGETEAYARRLLRESGCALLIVADESAGALPIPPDLPSIAVSPASHAALGLCVTGDVMWRCGDYALYAAQRARPDATGFWLIEPDVRVHVEHLAHPFATLDTDGLDFATAKLHSAGPDWEWYHSIAWYEPLASFTMLQLSFFSARAVAHLHRSREALSAAHRREGRPPAQWPNDEVFVASTLVNASFSCRTFDSLGLGLAWQDSFTVTTPTSSVWLADRPADNAIYHPVCTGPAYLGRMDDNLRRWIATHGNSDGFGATLPQSWRDQFDREYGPEARHAFETRLRQTGSAPA